LKGMLVGLDGLDERAPASEAGISTMEKEPEGASTHSQQHIGGRRESIDHHRGSKAKEAESSSPVEDTSSSHSLSKESLEDPSSPLSMSDTDIDIEPRRTPPGPMMDPSDIPHQEYDEDVVFRRSNLPPPRRTVVSLKKENGDGNGNGILKEDIDAMVSDDFEQKDPQATTAVQKSVDSDASFSSLQGSRIDRESMDLYDGSVPYAQGLSARMLEEEEWEKRRRLARSRSSDQPWRPTEDHSDECKDLPGDHITSDRSGDISWKDSDPIDIETVSPISVTSLSNSSHASRRSIESRGRGGKKSRKQRAPSVSEEDKQRKSKDAMERAKRRAAERLRQEKESRMMREKEVEDRRERLLKLVRNILESHLILITHSRFSHRLISLFV
jgi:hypothetical protein